MDHSALLDARSPASLQEIPSPALVVELDKLTRNVDRLIDIAGRPERLWPHIKTHKTREITAMLMERGVRTFKCATLPELFLCAETGADEVLYAYPLIGPNVGRFVRLAAAFPQTRFAALVDSRATLSALTDAVAEHGPDIDVFLDLDVGMHRTGIGPGDEALHLCTAVAERAHMKFAGLHVYDGHNHQPNVDDRRAAAAECYAAADRFAERVRSAGVAVPLLIMGGTPTFPQYAEFPEAHLSPGTAVIHDWGYKSSLPDLPFEPAAFVLGRVLSTPSPGQITLDVGCKAIAADPPGMRGYIPEIPEAQSVLQNEEHWILNVPEGQSFEVGTVVRVIPTHICPTFNLYEFVYVVDANGSVVDTWDVAARGR